MFPTVRNLFIVGLVLLSSWLAIAGNLSAQDVSARISSREAWVGSPVVLQIQVANARNYSLPDGIEIDGCSVRTAGAPSQSSQVMIINGRRSESRSVTMQYLITPRREGKFKIPELEIEVDGKTKTTQAIQFIATKSDTGDLMFVEVEGNKETVYVGQPLDLKLKVWIKPFTDREKQVKLNEGHLWQMISEQTSWGAFTERLQELAENRQRPGGKSVLRKDTQGREREYYLYEIEATVYPNKPGKIDASDLQIVVNYPQALGRGRDPFAGFFDDSPFGGRSLIEEMMGGGSPLGRRLTVSKSRPIVAETNVDSTEVLAVPVAHRPADYRGAVGRYRIMAEAEPTSVSAGEPITLRIGIVGDGPMELVQAPPLHDIKSLTSDFQITDQSLAGFVQDETKVFVTTIRPRNETVTQIPAIPFSFFDPDKEIYGTVFTKPIEIEVEKAESLSMDAIVSDLGAGKSTDSGATTARLGRGAATAMSGFNLRNELSLDVRQTQQRTTRRWWWYFAIIPPVCCAAVMLGKLSFALPAIGASLRSPRSLADRKIRRATRTEELADAHRAFIASLTSSECPTHKHAVGKLREVGGYEVAAKLESHFGKLESQLTLQLEIDNDAVDQVMNDLRQASLTLLDPIEQVCKTGRSRTKPASKSKFGASSRTGVTTSVFWFFWLLTMSAGLAASPAMASEDWSVKKLASETRKTILIEANAAYEAAEEIVDAEPAKARQQFASSAQGYQLLVDEGVRNSNLFFNLGNAWLRSGDETNAVVNYHRALWMNPDHAGAHKNLRMIEKIQSSKELEADVETERLLDFSRPDRLIAKFRLWFGWNFILIVFAIASSCFWLLVMVKIFRPKLKIAKWCVVPLLVLIVFGSVIYQHEHRDEDLAVVVAKTIELKSGDGIEFPTEALLESTAATVVNVIGDRADWCKVKLPNGQTGWLRETDLQRVAMRD